MAMATSTDRPTFTTPVERAALALAEEHKVAAIRCINFIPINETDSSLSAADIALFLLSLPRELPFRKLVLSIDRQYTNIPEKLIAKWCLLRQRLDGEEDEKENAPPLLSTPTRLPEGRSASPASFLPQVLPSAPSTRHTSLVSPIPEANNIDVPILSTSAAVLSFPEPAPSDHTKIVTLPPSTADDIPLLEPPSYALFENLAVASEKDVPGPHCSAHLPGNIPTQGEDTQSPHTASSPSLFSRSSLSSPQPCSSSVQHPLLPKPRTRLVQALRDISYMIPYSLEP
ncbi:hypothetical protein CPB85DRAFT_584863 [Mucidula mucida]|nr:hypothetical protein CPB85DRAFT_584863 [Mucidula mucida]